MSYIFIKKWKNKDSTYDNMNMHLSVSIIEAALWKEQARPAR